MRIFLIPLVVAVLVIVALLMLSVPPHAAGALVGVRTDHTAVAELQRHDAT